MDEKRSIKRFEWTVGQVTIASGGGISQSLAVRQPRRVVATHHNVRSIDQLRLVAFRRGARWRRDASSGVAPRPVGVAATALAITIDAPARAMTTVRISASVAARSRRGSIDLYFV